MLRETPLGPRPDPSTPSSLFPLLDPALDQVPRSMDLRIDEVPPDGDVGPREAPAPLDAVAGGEVGVGHGGDALLEAPQQVGGVAHGDGDDEPAGADAEGEGRRGPHDQVPVPRHDAAGHGRHQDVAEPRQELLAALARRRQRRDRRRERLLQAERPVHRPVHGVLGRQRLPVQEEPRSADLDGEPVCGRGPPVVGAVPRLLVVFPRCGRYRLGCW